MRSRREKHAPARGVPNREGEIAVQLGNAILAKFIVKMKDDLRVAARPEYPALRLQGIPKLDIIEDLAIEDDR